MIRSFPMPQRPALRLRAPVVQIAAAALVLALMGARPPIAAGEAPRPNILFIMADDHAAHAISAYGSRINRTPNIDRIGREGMRFANCFAVNSICSPSRAAILTGKYSHINGVTVFNRFDGSQWTFPKAFQQAGYFTAILGKWHLFSDPTGFDYWNILPGQGKYHDPDFIEMGVRTNLHGYVTDLITDLTLATLERRPKDKPFLIFCHHKAPHRRWEPDAKHAALYEEADIPEPPTFNDDYRTRCAAAREATMTVDRHLTRNDLKLEPPPGLSPQQAAKWRAEVDLEMDVPINGKTQHLSGVALKRWKYQRYIKDYLRCVASVDDNVGRLLDYLDRSGLSRNTIVIYTSDQGFFLGDHNWYDKRFMYEESIRMPFLIRYPERIPPGRVNRAMILNVDFAPTLLDLAGLPVPPDVQGRSFKPLLEGRTPADWRTAWYYRYYHYPGDHRVQPHYGVRTERYKLIYFNRLDCWELFDLQRDPHELHNLYDQPRYAPVVRRLKDELARLRRELDDHDQLQDVQR
jgi:arylsulfatase A-like enzyme